MTEQAYVNVLTRGDLSSLSWIASPLNHSETSNPNMQLCRVYYSSLNFRDIMLATGKLPPDAIPGRECIEDTQQGILHFIGSYNNSNQQHLVLSVIIVVYTNIERVYLLSQIVCSHI